MLATLGPVQVDWEAILANDPQLFITSMSRWFIPTALKERQPVQEWPQEARQCSPGNHEQSCQLEGDGRPRCSKCYPVPVDNLPRVALALPDLQTRFPALWQY